MKIRRKGFVGIEVVIGIALVAVAAFFFAKYQSSQKLGLSLQTQLTDTIGTFRTNVNASLSTLDASVATITSTQATYGTIVTANSPLPTANGGTATSTAPTNAQFLSASGSIPTWKSFTFQAGLNSTTTPTTTLVGNVGFDNTANISFTGKDNFTQQLGVYTSTSTAPTSTDALNILPAGVIQMFGGSTSTTPTGWIICDGTQYATSTYPRLFTVIGYTYGGSGANFAVPNFKHSVAIGYDANVASSSAIGQTGGTATTTLTLGNLPAFQPGFLRTNGTGGGGSGADIPGVSGGNHSYNNGNPFDVIGSSTPFSTLPPYVTVNYIIKY